MNSVLEYKELARRAALRAGPGYLKVFLIYAAILAVLNLVIYQLETPVYEWFSAANQYVMAGNFELPPFTRRLGGCLAFVLLLSFLGKTVTAGWLLASLRASRGEGYSWHTLSERFNVFWKVFVIAFVYEIGCTLASYLLIFPGILLFYNWRLSFFVLAEHPEYGPLQCMKQSRKLMKGERMQLFKLDLSMIFPYGIAFLANAATGGILSLWKMPSIALLYTVFYNKMVYWQEPEDTQEPPAEAM